MMSKNDVKKGQQGLLDFLKENHVISFVWNWCKTKVLMVWSLIFCENCMSGKNLVLMLCQNWLLANEISAFFNRQYFMNRLIYDFIFWDEDRDD